MHRVSDIVSWCTDSVYCQFKWGREIYYGALLITFFYMYRVSDIVSWFRKYDQFSNFQDTSFSASQKIMIPKYNTVSYS